MVFDLANKEITVDKRLNVVVDGKSVIVKVFYDKKITKIKRKQAFDHVLLRVPPETTDEYIEKYMNKWFLKNWIKEQGINPELQDIPQLEEEIKEYNLKVNERTMEEFKQIVEKNVEKHVERFGRPKQLIYRKLEGAWAKCNRNKDKLTFDYKMRYLNEEYIEFIVYHEMIHLYCLNHNPPFYREMEKIYKNWKEYNRILTTYNYLLYKEEKYI